MFAQSRIFCQHARVGRQELRFITPNGRHYATRYEVRRVFERPDELIDHLSDFDCDGAPGALAICKEEHRRGLVSLAELVQQRGRLCMRTLGVQSKIPVEEPGA